MPKKGGLRQFANLRGGLARKWRVVFLRGIDTPTHTMMAHYSKEGLLPKIKRRLRIKILYDGFIFFTFKEKLRMFT